MLRIARLSTATFAAHEKYEKYTSNASMAIGL